jgi:hypothetical protein
MLGTALRQGAQCCQCESGCSVVRRVGGREEGYVCEREKRGTIGKLGCCLVQVLRGGGALRQTRRAVKAAAFAGVT